MTVPAPNFRRNLKVSAADGASFGGMVGLGESYLAAFALVIGMSEVSAGLVASVPMVVGGTFQLISPAAVGWIGSAKRWILLGATVQALAFVPLVYTALVGTISLPALLLIASVYWGAGLATGPAWNTWIETIVPATIRTRYFASRSRLAQLTTLAGFLLGGAILTVGQWSDRDGQAYAVMFAAAGLLRLCSVYWLTQHHPIERRRSATTSAGNPPESNPIGRSLVRGGRLLLFLVFMQGMVQLASPFFTPFMLGELGFTYLQFVALIAVSFMAKILSLSMWARWTRGGSAKSLLWIGSIGIVPASALWIVSQQFLWLIFVQAIGGVVWAAYELGFLLMFFESLPRARRIRMLTIYNFGNTLAICIGAMIGASILRWQGATASGYLTLFALSAIGRGAALAILASATLGSVPVLKIGVRVLGLRPGLGSLDSPVLSSFDEGVGNDAASKISDVPPG